MEITKETLLKMLDEIREYIETNSNSDGTFNFDKERNLFCRGTGWFY